MKPDRVDQTQASAAAKTFRRRVFYIPGYDPFPPRRYRELYRKEGAEQARMSGYALTQGPKRTPGGFGWHVSGQIGGQATEAEVEVLVWSDIVQGSMATSIPATYLQLLRTAWAYIGSGALFRLMRLPIGPMIAALYPIAVLLLQLAVAVAIGIGAATLAAWGLDALTGVLSLPMGTLPARALAAGAAVAATWMTLRGFQRLDPRIFAWYLMHDYAYSAQAGGANPPELEARMAEFGARIRTALDTDADEVLVVGHSSGAHLGVSILADLWRAGLPDPGPALAFLSLGHVVPMVSFLPGARRLRGDLRALSAQDDIAWIDVTAPGDGCAFALCDPVAVTGVAPPGKRWPLVLSAAFSQTLSPERYQSLKRRYFRLHFQYLCAFDRPRDYDYFQITAGPLTLADRFRGRAPSKSRIETPVNRFTDWTG
jgi:hypothetical protein